MGGHTGSPYRCLVGQPVYWWFANRAQQAAPLQVGGTRTGRTQGSPLRVLGCTELGWVVGEGGQLRLSARARVGHHPSESLGPGGSGRVRVWGWWGGLSPPCWRLSGRRRLW